MFTILLRTTFRKKNIYIYFMLLLFCLLILTLLNFTNNYIDSMIGKVENQLSNRELIITRIQDNENFKDSKESIMKINHINNVYNYFPSFNIEIEDFGNFIAKVGILEEIPKITAGRTLNLNKSDEIILPDKIYKDNKEYMVSDILGDYVDIILNLSDKKTELSLKVVGTYEATENSTNAVYLSDSMLEENNVIKNNSYLIIVDNQKNVSYVNDILGNHYDVSLYNDTTQSELGSYQMLKTMISTFVIIISITTFILITVFVYIIINDNKRNIAILKVIGYKNIYIFLNVLIATLTLVMLVFFIILIISFLLMLLFLVFDSNINALLVIPIKIFLVTLLITLISNFIFIIKINIISIKKIIN